MDDRNLPASCDCGGVAERVFTAIFQLITSRAVDLPENKYALGFDEKTRTETRKQDDETYETAWNHQNPTKPKPLPKIHETYRELYGEIRS